MKAGVVGYSYSLETTFEHWYRWWRCDMVTTWRVQKTVAQNY